ncbi:MAG: hypothetical protein C4542_09645 [Dehalococcoidia bacterium]|nr:MAG: hypothetical protein C4542_09645 [Dehalococcoidia bacterium]
MSLENAVGLIMRYELELEVKGYPPALVKMAIDRARGTAMHRVAPISEAIRDQAYHDILAHELQDAEAWIVRQQEFLGTAQ